ncbi:MAG: hypothetical protein AB8C84_07650 [Oligoflexales bacterium]
MAFIFKVLLLSVLILGCDTNPLGYVSTGKDTPKAQREQARIHLDNQDYSAAHAILNDLASDVETDSNEVRLLLSAATLGAAGIEIWALMTDLLSGNTTIESGGMSEILSSVTGAVLGSGEVLETKLIALDQAVAVLRSAPDSSNEGVNNMACVLAGIAISPSIANATTAFGSLQTAVDAIDASGGSCSSVSDLTETLAQVSALSSRFSEVMSLSEQCPFLEIDTSATSGVDSILGTLSTTADQGCLSPNPFLPSCLVTEAASDVGTAVAQDGDIASCELIYNCFTPSGLSSCFSS